MIDEEKIFDDGESNMARDLSAFLWKHYGKCPDFHGECSGCQRWAAFNVIFPDHSVKWTEDYIGDEATEEPTDLYEEKGGEG